MTPQEAIEKKILARFTGNIDVLCAYPGIRKAVTDVTWYSKRLSVPGISAGIVENILYKFVTRHTIGSLSHVSECVRRNILITLSDDITYELIELLHQVKTSGSAVSKSVPDKKRQRLEDTVIAEPVFEIESEPELVSDTDTDSEPETEPEELPANPGLDHRLATDRTFTLQGGMYYEYPKYSKLPNVPGMEDNTSGYSSIEPDDPVDCHEYSVTPPTVNDMSGNIVPVTALMGDNYIDVARADVIRMLPVIVFDSYFDKDRLRNIIEYHRIDTSDLTEQYIQDPSANKERFNRLRKYASRDFDASIISKLAAGRDEWIKYDGSRRYIQREPLACPLPKENLEKRIKKRIYELDNVKPAVGTPTSASTPAVGTPAVEPANTFVKAITGNDDIYVRSVKKRKNKLPDYKFQPFYIPMVKTARTYPKPGTPKLSGDSILSDAVLMKKTAEPESGTVYGYTAQGEQTAPAYVYNQSTQETRVNEPETGEMPVIPQALDIQLPYSDIDFRCSQREHNQTTEECRQYIVDYREFKLPVDDVPVPGTTSNETVCSEFDINSVIDFLNAENTARDLAETPKMPDTDILTRPQMPDTDILARIEMLEKRLAEILVLVK